MEYIYNYSCVITFSIELVTTATHKTETPPNSNAIHKLMPKYLVTNFNFDMNASTVTVDKNNFYVAGNFRTGKDLVGVKWKRKIIIVTLI